MTAFIAGAVASVAGFGIGSLLTPLLSVQLGTKAAVAAVAIPHLAATILRFWMLRAHVDRGVLLRFGLMSAAGSLMGALLHARLESPGLGRILAALLIFAGMRGLIGLGKRLRFSDPWTWVAGALSGAFGGLVGNQGGIRSAAMLTFDVPKEAFVATATAIGLMVDAARMPVYFITEFRDITAAWPLIMVGTTAALTGTLLGKSLLSRIPERVFSRVVSTLILVLGLGMWIAS